MFQILVTKPATQAVFLVTIFLLKLKQSLRIGSGRYRQTGTIPKSGYVIVFDLQGFKETGGTVTQNVIGLVQAISIKKRDDRIDGNQIQGTVPTRFSLRGETFLKLKCSSQYAEVLAASIFFTASSVSASITREKSDCSL